MFTLQAKNNKGEERGIRKDENPGINLFFVIYCMLMLTIFVLLKFLRSFLSTKIILFILFHVYTTLCLESIRSEIGDLIILIKMYDSRENHKKV